MDANLLVYGASAEGPYFERCRNLLSSGKPLCLSPQVVAEAYSVLTDPRRVQPVFGPHEAVNYLRVVANRFPSFAITRQVTERWMGLIAQRPVSRGRIFDLQIIATMLENDVHRIYTLNTADFAWHPDLEVLVP